MINTVIVEDEKYARKNLQNMLADYCPNINLVGEANGLQSGVDVIKKQNPDLIFLDINFGDGTTGFDLLDRFPNPNFSVIVTTAYETLAVRAFHYNAIHFLVKPIDPDLLIDAVKRIEKNKIRLTSEQLESGKKVLKTGKIDQIFISTSEGYYVIIFDDLIHIRSNGNVTSFYLNSGKRVMTTTFTMSELMKNLPLNQFFRTHQSHIVNRKFVIGYMNDEGVKMKDENYFPVARSKRKDFLNWLKG